MATGLVLHENRKLVRCELIYYLKVIDRQNGLELGRIGDLHTEGMLLLTPELLPDQAVYDLLLELPKAMAEEVGYPGLPVQAQVVWSKPGPKLGNHWENGARFLNPSPQARKVINRLTEIFAMPGS
jgi:hypothetical protein